MFMNIIGWCLCVFAFSFLVGMIKKLIQTYAEFKEAVQVMKAREERDNYYRRLIAERES